MDFRSYTLEPNRVERISIHVLFWISVIVFQVIYGLGYSQPVLVSLVIAAVYLPAQLISTYLFIHVVLKFVQQRKWLIFIVLTLCLTLVNYYITHINRDLGIGRMVVSWHEPHTLLEILKEFDFFIWYNIYNFIVVFVATSIKLIRDHFISSALLADLESVKVQNETNLIRANIKPQFLLSSLDAIRSSAKVSIESTPNLINNLSVVLDDAIYRNDDTKRSIELEVEGLKNICTLYQEVYNSIGNISIHLEVDNYKVQVPTRLLLKTTEIYIQTINQVSDNDRLASILLSIIQLDDKVILQIETPSSKFMLSQAHQDQIHKEISDLSNPRKGYKIEIDFFEGSENNDFQLVLDL